jgi:hypothetical protein
MARIKGTQPFRRHGDDHQLWLRRRPLRWSVRLAGSALVITLNV